MTDFFTNWSALSSDGIFGDVFSFLGGAADWAGAVSDLLGLL